MKVAIYTITRDRLEYTKHCFHVLKRKAGYPYDHFIVDNGSTDGTQEWLKDNFQEDRLILLTENKGISLASNLALDKIGDKYDLIIKMDNDCEVEYEGLLDRIVRIYENMPPLRNLMLSPKVNGLVHQPFRYGKTMVDDCEIGLTNIVGGLFHVIPAKIYQQFRYNEYLPYAKGQDENICNWFKLQGGEVGYIEPISVNHYETTNGQAKRYPEYFERKKIEETTSPQD